MRLLLDTHIFLWIVTNDRRLSARARKLISGADERFVSSASIWEAAIKAGLGKLDIDVGRLVRSMGPSGIRELPVSAVHGAVVRDLPHHHRDPFDRLLVAQARHEPLQLVTADAQLARYGLSVVLTV
ncbi:type II toxin-antitoxin system VapC family toxin [Burkholderia sp. JKS000303]|uniref:type II toxin-antitoxin system VapC family toxin n=1 Tax=Burkholderia sp. JKS000303 TaxID=1938747 RepID=UPI000BF8A7A7|nr:type II toxin-antitoxin system VapC family toxin [Burkholderia sp. JKS000303]PFH28001.1 PIN domain nuclease of toxin-antitoxin system [Burkholderia sp. JKS000303]